MWDKLASTLLPTVLRLSLVAALLSGCVTQPLSTDGSDEIDSNEGLLAVRFLSNWKGNESAIFDELSFGIANVHSNKHTVLEMRSNNDLQLVPLLEGDYIWYQAAIGSSYLRFGTTNPFSIRPGQITYVGDITLDVRLEPFELTTEALEVEDNHLESLAQLRVDYGELLNGYDISLQVVDLHILEF